MLRTIIVVAFVVVFLIVSIPIWLVLAIIGIFNKKAKDEIGFKIVAGAFHIVWFLSGTKPEIHGLEKVPTDRAVLYVGNHQSFFDVILAYSIVPTVTGFLSKKTFEKVPLLSVWMHHLYCVFLTRDNPREDLKLMLVAIEHLKNGISMFVFPEGTRSKNGEMAEFHEASFKLSTKSKAPIIPVCFTNTREILEAHSPFIKKQRVIITFCDPIDPTTMDAKEQKHLGALVKDVIQKQLEEDAKLL